MPRCVKAYAVIVAFAGLPMIQGCTQRGEAAPNPDDLATLSPDVFSHVDVAEIVDQRCIGTTGVLITASAIGPVTVGTPLSRLRQRCAITLVRVPPSVAIRGPVFGVSVSGGLIVFTVSGRDSVIETAGSASPAFRTSNGIGVDTPARGLSYKRGRVCFQRDSTRITRVFVSRHAITC
jgi:hypothetical protein